MAKQQTSQKSTSKKSKAVRIVVLFVALMAAAGGVVATDGTLQAMAAEPVETVEVPATVKPVAEATATAVITAEPTPVAEVTEEAVEETPDTVRDLDYGTACETADCAGMLETYELAGLYHRGDGDTYVPEGKLMDVLAAYADLLGGAEKFAERVGGEGGLQYIVFDFSKRGNYAGDYYAIYCPEDRLESCTGGTKAGTLFLNMDNNASELRTTMAHEFTHAMDFKTNMATVDAFNRVGGNDAITLKDRDYENHAELIAQYLFPTGGATPAPDTWDRLLHRYINECFVADNFNCDISQEPSL